MVHTVWSTYNSLFLGSVIGQAIKTGMIWAVVWVPARDSPDKDSRSTNFIISSGYMTLHKDTISDLHIKVRSSISNPMLSYSFRSDRQWRLQQIQDAGNSIELASVYAQNGAKYAKKALRIVLRAVKLVDTWLL